ncbi:MAG: hypothetical protein V3V19_03405 [Cocleimonas sp.]
MSTKSSIVSGEDYHLYDELMDGGVYLEVSNATNASIDIIDGRAFVKLRLPKELIERLKLDDTQLVEPSKMFDDDSIMNSISNGKK